MGRCFLCDPPRPVPDLELMAHLQEEHPGEYGMPAQWPDGKPVVIDQSLEPEDFAA